MHQVPVDAFILDALMPDLIGHDRKPAALVVFLHLYRRAVDQPGWAVRLSHQSIAGATGLSRSAVQSALTHLQRRELVLTSRSSPTAVPLHRVQRPWQRLSRSAKK